MPANYIHTLDENIGGHIYTVTLNNNRK